MAVWFKVLRVRIGVCRSTNNELFWIIWKKRIDFPWKFVLPMLSMFLFPYFMSNKSFTWNGRWRWHVLVGCHDLSWAWLKLHTQCTKKNWSIATNHPWKIHKKMWNVTLVENYTTIDVILQLCLDWLGDPMVGRLISETIKMNIAPLNHGPNWRVETAGSVGEAHFGGPGSFWQHSACVGCWGIWFSFEKVTFFGTKPSNYIDLFYLGWNWYDNLASC